MRNAHMKIAVATLAISIGASPVLGCTTVPQANTSRTTQLMEVSSAATAQEQKPADDKKPEAKAEDKKAEEKKPEEKKPDEKKCDEKKPEQVKPSEEKKPEDETKKDDPKKTESKKPAGKKEEKKSDEKPAEDAKEDSAFTIDNFAVTKAALEELGVTTEALEQKIKEGKKLIDVLTEEDIPVKKFKKVLYKQYVSVIKEGVKAGKISKEDAKLLKSTIKQKVNSWMSEKEDK
ncbi:MAG: hypothetical protein ATN36_04030 [Epulopiscium sp. Nele67-Bin005]|nr:MAG: hypothetical protein ATN36_04030 [Epulopiscium sp. Nele67-Bin005]